MICEGSSCRSDVTDGGSCWESERVGDVVLGGTAVETVSSALGRSGEIFERSRANLKD